MRLPRRVKPHREIGISDGNGDWEASTSSGMKRRDLERLRWRLTEEPSFSMIPSAVMRSSGEPTRVPSSKYHVFKARSGTSDLIRSTMGWRERAKPSGPKGSPCCTPQQLRTVSWPRRSKA